MTRYRHSDRTANLAIKRADRATPTLTVVEAEHLADRAAARGDQLGYLLFAAAARRAA